MPVAGRAVVMGPEGARQEDIFLAEEKPFTIFWNNQELLTILCTPTHLDELAVGFIYSSGLLQGLGGVTRIDIDAGQGIAWVTGRGVEHPQEQFRRYLGSGCAGGSGFYTLGDALLTPQVEEGPVVTAQAIKEWMRQVQVMSGLYLQTRGVHAAALTASGEGITLFREDIGRHNAVDKIIGSLYLRGVTAAGHVLLTTGRISSEILTKAARGSIYLVVSRSVPTSLACSYAEQLGITLVGRVRGRHFYVYTHPHRILAR